MRFLQVAFMWFIAVNVSIAYGAAPCPSGSTTYISTAGGNASNPATWGGVSIGTADGACLVATGGTVIIDEDLGSGPTGVALVVAGGSFATPEIMPAQHNCGGGYYSVCILINSTGTDPCGSGTTALPGTDATSHGILVLNGNVTLIGDSVTAPIYIGSADGKSPWFVAKPDSRGSANITLKGAALTHLGGANSCGSIYPIYSGIFLYDTANPTSQSIDVENLYVSDYFRFVSAQASKNNHVSVIAKKNLLVGRRGPTSLFGGYNGLFSIDIEDNTEMNPAADGSFATWSTIASNVVTSGNAVAGSSDFSAGGSSFTGPPDHTTVSNNLVVNYPLKAANSVVRVFEPYSDFTIAQNYCEYGNQCFYAGSSLLSNAATMTGNIAITNSLASKGQGVYYGQAGGTLTASRNLCVFTDQAWTLHAENSACMDVYGNRQGLASELALNNTFLEMVPLNVPGTSTGVAIADSDVSHMSNNLVKGNLIAGFYYGIWESSVNSGNVYQTSGPGNVGAYGNATFGTSVPYYYNSRPSNWDDGIHLHPDPFYGDINGANVSFIDQTRLSIAEYDRKVLKGPGTTDDFMIRLGYRSGWAGTYTLGATPVADLISWVSYGFKPKSCSLSGYGAYFCISDVNEDGKVDCSDVSVIRAAYGKTLGQPGFNSKADVNSDGTIDIRDLALVSQSLSAGTRCQ